MMQNKNKFFILVYIVPLLLSLWACKINEPEEDVFFNGDEYQNIMQYIDENPQYSSFAKIVRSASMTDVLSSYNHHIGGNDYTLFLPDDLAVQAFLDQNTADYPTLESLLSDSLYARSVVRYHTINSQILAEEFPNGVLSDKTLSFEYLTVVFRESGDSIIKYINNESSVKIPNLQLSNGIVHTIGKMLTPIVRTSYELFDTDPEYSIFTEMLQKVGLEDTMNYSVLDPETDRYVYNQYTVFAESNTLYNDYGITSFDQLAQLISPGNTDYLSDDNPLNIYAKYHILDKSYFLDEFSTTVFNTYSKFPISVDLNKDLKINIGTEVFDTLIVGGDTSLINYLLLDIDKSNKISKSGAIHQLNRMLYPFKPSLQKVEFDFYEDAYIFQKKDVSGTYSFQDEDLDYIDFVGIESVDFIRQNNVLTIKDYPDDVDRDFIEFDGNVVFSYTIPKVLPGRYTLQLLCKRNENDAATIQTYVDDVRVGSVEDLSTAATSNTVFYYIDLGIVRFDEYTSHVVKIETIKSGNVKLAKIILKP